MRYLKHSRFFEKESKFRNTIFDELHRNENQDGKGEEKIRISQAVKREGIGALKRFFSGALARLIQLQWQEITTACVKQDRKQDQRTS